MVGRVLMQGDEPGGGNCARAHGPDVGGPKLAGAHLRDGDGAGIDGVGQFFAEEVNQRHEDEPGEDASGEDDAGDARTDDVADAEIFRRGVGLDGCALEDVLRAEVGLVLGRAGPGFEEVLILEEGVEAAEAEAEKDAAGERAAALAGDEHVGAGGAFGIWQVAVFLDDELAAQGNHEEDAEPAADEGEHEDAGVLEIEAEKDQRGEGEDDARGDGLAGVAGGLDDVVFEDGGAAEGAENADGENRDGDGGGYGESGAQAHIDGDGAKDDAEEGAEENGAEGEFRAVLAGRDEWLKDGGLRVWHGLPPNEAQNPDGISLKGEFSSEGGVGNRGVGVDG